MASQLRTVARRLIKVNNNSDSYQRMCFLRMQLALWEVVLLRCHLLTEYFRSSSGGHFFKYGNSM